MKHEKTERKKLLKSLSHLEALSGERISTQQPTHTATGKWVELPGKGNI